MPDPRLAGIESQLRAGDARGALGIADALILPVDATGCHLATRDPAAGFRFDGHLRPDALPHLRPCEYAWTGDLFQANLHFHLHTDRRTASDRHEHAAPNTESHPYTHAYRFYRLVAVPQ